MDDNMDELTQASQRLMEPIDIEENADPSVSIDHAEIRQLLYSSHFLSAWNSRVFEFGAFLFLAAIYPGTLLPASVYAFARAASAAALSPSVGSFIDRTDRMRVVRISIGKQYDPS